MLVGGLLRSRCLTNDSPVERRPVRGCRPPLVLIGISNVEHVHMKKCSRCGAVIDPERLDALPHTTMCTPCARLNPEPLRLDPNVVCDIGSASARNGWGKSS